MTVQYAPYKILTDDHPLLRERAKNVEYGDSVGHVISRMIVTMKEAGGVGLAAPQVGVSKRIIVVQVGVDWPLAMINPIITVRRGQRTSTEGCLSLPGRSRTIVRSTEVLVTYDELVGPRRVLSASGLVSIIIQHEVDHLNGVLMTDHPTADEAIATVLAEEGMVAATNFAIELGRAS